LFVGGLLVLLLGAGLEVFGLDEMKKKNKNAKNVVGLDSILTASDFVLMFKKFRGVYGNDFI
jgi:hypothetical protein